MGSATVKYNIVINVDLNPTLLAIFSIDTVFGLKLYLEPLNKMLPLEVKAVFADPLLHNSPLLFWGPMA